MCWDRDISAVEGRGASDGEEGGGGQQCVQLNLAALTVISFIFSFNN